jgi:Flp pilus assembly protein TadD
MPGSALAQIQLRSEGGVGAAGGGRRVAGHPFPKSGNAHDSLAYACNRAGDRVRAIRNYQRSLVLDPKNDNARVMLEALR